VLLSDNLCPWGVDWVITACSLPSLFILLALSFQLFYTYGEDGIGVKMEIRIVAGIAVCYFIAATIYDLVVRDVEKLQVPLFMLRTVAWWLVHVVSICYGLYCVYRSQGRDKGRQPLVKFLDRSANRQHFLQFLEAEFAAENLQFWRAVNQLHEHYGGVSADVDMAVLDEHSQQVAKMVHDYVVPMAPFQINISSALRDQIVSTSGRVVEDLKKLSAAPESNSESDLGRREGIHHTLMTIFEDAQHEILELMENDSYPRFLNKQEAIWHDQSIAMVTPGPGASPSPKSHSRSLEASRHPLSNSVSSSHPGAPRPEEPA